MMSGKVQKSLKSLFCGLAVWWHQLAGSSAAPREASEQSLLASLRRALVSTMALQPARVRKTREKRQKTLKSLAVCGGASAGW